MLLPGHAILWHKSVRMSIVLGQITFQKEGSSGEPRCVRFRTIRPFAGEASGTRSEQEEAKAIDVGTELKDEERGTARPKAPHVDPTCWAPKFVSSLHARATRPYPLNQAKRWSYSLDILVSMAPYSITVSFSFIQTNGYGSTFGAAKRRNMNSSNSG